LLPFLSFFLPFLLLVSLFFFSLMLPFFFSLMLRLAMLRLGSRGAYRDGARSEENRESG
jgi:hypothetical protein